MIMIDREKALSFPLANEEYDQEHANEYFIMGCETYKEWLENLPVIKVVRCRDCKYMDAVYPYCNAWENVTEEDGYCYKGEK